MKTILTILAIALTTSVFAGNEGKTSDKEKAAVIQNVEQIVSDQNVVDALGIDGTADVTLTVDEAGVVHVAAVQTDDFLLEYHIRKSIESAKMIVEDSLVGKTINLIVKVVDNK